MSHFVALTSDMLSAHQAKYLGNNGLLAQKYSKKYTYYTWGLPANDSRKSRLNQLGCNLGQSCLPKCALIGRYLSFSILRLCARSLCNLARVPAATVIAREWNQFYQHSASEWAGKQHTHAPTALTQSTGTTSQRERASAALAQSAALPRIPAAVTCAPGIILKNHWNTSAPTMWTGEKGHGRWKTGCRRLVNAGRSNFRTNTCCYVR